VVLHVLDITHPNAAEQAQTTRQVLGELGAADRPTITVLNKIDLLDGAAVPDDLMRDLNLPPDYVPVSAQRGVGLAALLERIAQTLEQGLVDVSVTVPYARNDLVELFHREGQVASVEYGEAGTALTGQLPPRLLDRFRVYSTTAKSRRQTRRARATRPVLAS
jgi:GTPase